MPTSATLLYPALQEYRGRLTRPEKWADWTPNEGDVVVCTPAKSGTTWTQTMIAMLLYGTTELPDRLSALSPWLDSALGDADRVPNVPLSPSGRRVVKTHTPSDGFPIWKGVHVVAVYRHPLDVFLSIRKHVINMKDAEDPVLCGPLPTALESYLNGVFDPQASDKDSLSSVISHYSKTTQRPHQKGLVLLHYANMIADPVTTVRKLADDLSIEHDPTLIEAIVRATRIDTMRSKAKYYAPEGGKGFWTQDAAFFDGGGTRKWEGLLSGVEEARFLEVLHQLLPSTVEQQWLTIGK
ncbi:MAG: sulfotransferase domain-containing protein [Roseobacter sp.]